MPLFIVFSAVLCLTWSMARLMGIGWEHLADPLSLKAGFLIRDLCSRAEFLFLIGAYINIQSDNILLMNLRKPGETGYKIPQGGLIPLYLLPQPFW